MRGVLGLLLAVLGLGVVYTGYTGHLPGHGLNISGGNPDPFKGIGNAPPGWTPPPNSGIPSGVTINNAVLQSVAPGGGLGPQNRGGFAR